MLDNNTRKRLFRAIFCSYCDIPRFKEKQVDVVKSKENLLSIMDQAYFSTRVAGLAGFRSDEVLLKGIDFLPFAQGLSGLSQNVRVRYTFTTSGGTERQFDTLLKLYSTPFDTRDPALRSRLPTDSYEIAVYTLLRHADLGEYIPHIIAHFPEQHAFEMELMDMMPFREYLQERVLNEGVVRIQAIMLGSYHNDLVRGLIGTNDSRAQHKIEVLRQVVPPLLERASRKEVDLYPAVRAVVSALAALHARATANTIGKQLPPVAAVFRDSHEVKYVVDEIPICDFKYYMEKGPLRFIDSLKRQGLLSEAEEMEQDLVIGGSVLAKQLANAPAGFVHGDLNFNNILVKEEGCGLRVVFIDVARARYGAMISDLSDAIQGVDECTTKPLEFFLNHRLSPLLDDAHAERFIYENDGAFTVSWDTLLDII